jgi:hypothetical protein
MLSQGTVSNHAQYLLLALPVSPTPTRKIPNLTSADSIRFFAPEISRLPPRIFYWLFISADITCLILQAIGGALSSSSDGASQTGIDVARGIGTLIKLRTNRCLSDWKECKSSRIHWTFIILDVEGKSKGAYLAN